MRARALAVVPLVAVIAAGAASVEARSDEPTTDERTLRLIATLSSHNLMDQGEPGLDPGDGLVFGQDIVPEYDDKRPLGTAVGECRVVELPRAQCTATLTLADGQIAVQGMVESGSFEGALVVTGGTGLYRHASGEATVRRLGEGVHALVVRYRADASSPAETPAAEDAPAPEDTPAP
jgi:hypothetical protein